MNKLKSACCILALVFPLLTSGQTLSLEEAYESAKANFPLIRERALIEQSGQYSLQIIAKGSLPQLSVNGQATYQSEVTTLPISIPNISIPEISKDQYRIYAEAVQPLTDLITVKRQKAVQAANNSLALDNLETELYKLTDRLNNIYFGILLIDEQRKQNALTKGDIQSAINKVAAGVANGTDYRSSLDKLKAQSLTTDQRDIDLKASRKAFVAMLSLFVGRSLPDSIVLITPLNIGSAGDISRPELRAFESQQAFYDAQSLLVITKSLPKFSVYIQGGYGRPGLNFLNNDFKGYYIGGLRLNWSLSSLYTLKKEQRMLSLNKDMVAVQKETFLFNTSLALQQQSGEAERLQEALHTDDELLALRISIKTAAQAQLQNGVITVNDYLREVDAEDAARLQQSLHRIQLLQAQYSILNTTGNP